MDAIISFLEQYWLSLVLIVLLVIAIGYVYKRIKKFEHNHFE